MDNITAAPLKFRQYVVVLRNHGLGLLNVSSCVAKPK